MVHDRKPPVWFWIISVVAVLLNAIGAFDYVMTQFRVEFYMSNFTEEQLAYFYGFPSWYVAIWAIAVWSAFIASVGLCLRQAWSELAFGVSLIFFIIMAIWSFGFTDALPIMGARGAIFTVVIGLSLLGLLWFARISRQNKWLR